MMRIFCRCFGHNYIMTFPNEGTMDWLFVCPRCLHTTTDIQEAERTNMRIPPVTPTNVIAAVIGTYLGWLTIKFMIVEHIITRATP